jgi:hypothetical protein
VSAPKDVPGFHILRPVETQQEKYFVDHVLDITDQSLPLRVDWMALRSSATLTAPLGRAVAWQVVGE